MKEMKRYSKIFAIAACCAVTTLPACNSFESDADTLAGGVKEAWGDMDDAVEKEAKGIAESLAENPGRLEKDADGMWISLTDEFCLTNPNPFDDATQLAASMIFGDFGEAMVDVGNAARSLADKDYALKQINKHFNANWVALFNALIYLDGSFTYSLETDEILDNDFDFDVKEMVGMLRDRNVWSGGYTVGELDASNVDASAASDSGEEVSDSSIDLPGGSFSYTGDFIYNGKRYPVALSFRHSGGKISDAVYKNLTYGTTLDMTAVSGSGRMFTLSGTDNGTPLTIAIDRREGNNLYGKVTSGGIEMDVELHL